MSNQRKQATSRHPCIPDKPFSVFFSEDRSTRVPCHQTVQSGDLSTILTLSGASTFRKRIRSISSLSLYMGRSNTPKSKRTLSRGIDSCHLLNNASKRRTRAISICYLLQSPTRSSPSRFPIRISIEPKTSSSLIGWHTSHIPSAVCDILFVHRDPDSKIFSLQLHFKHGTTGDRDRVIEGDRVFRKRGASWNGCSTTTSWSNDAAAATAADARHVPATGAHDTASHIERRHRMKNTRRLCTSRGADRRQMRRPKRDIVEALAICHVTSRECGFDAMLRDLPPAAHSTRCDIR